MRGAIAILGGLLTLSGPTAALAADAVAISGPDGAAVTLSAADMAALPQLSVTVVQHGATHTYEGPRLSVLLAKVGAPLGEALKGPEMSDVVLVTARDGYRVSLGLAEADPATHASAVILADRMDGAPIGEAQGPFRLVVEGDLRPARSERMVQAVEVRRLPPSATLGAASGAMK
ncbi:MAG: molybdopterin-dependent oxidoreductase [Caulobacterales bacterium]